MLLEEGKPTAGYAIDRRGGESDEVVQEHPQDPGWSAAMECPDSDQPGCYSARDIHPEADKRGGQIERAGDGASRKDGAQQFRLGLAPREGDGASWFSPGPDSTILRATSGKRSCSNWCNPARRKAGRPRAATNRPARGLCQTINEYRCPVRRAFTPSPGGL